MKIWVTGGAGFIGSHLVDRLVADKHQVTVIDDFSNGFLENLVDSRSNIRIIREDIAKQTWISDNDADVIFHFACHPRSMSFDNPARDINTNLIGSVNAIKFAIENDAKMIFSSNSGIYDATNLPISETTPDHPKTPYDLNKQSTEKLMAMYSERDDLECTIFRFPTVYGDRQRTRLDWKPVVSTFINDVLLGNQSVITGDGNQTRDLVYVSDIIDALVKAMDTWTEPRPILLGSGIETSINDIFRIVCEECGVNAKPTYIPKIFGDINRMRYQTDLAYNLLNWKAIVDIRTGIRKVINHKKKEILDES